MGWFDGGSSNNDPPPAQEMGFSDTGGGSYASPSDYGGMSGGGGGGLSEIQAFGVQLQQQILAQQVITELAQKSFEKCCTSSNSSTLSGKEVACISTVTNKWLDTNEFLLGRLSRKQQSAGSQYS